MKLILNLIKWLVGIALMVVFFGFAIKNMEEVGLHFFMDYEMHSPLILLLFEVFMGGVIFGVLGMSYVAFRNYREVSKLKKTIAGMVQEADLNKPVVHQPQLADTLANK